MRKDKYSETSSAEPLSASGDDAPVARRQRIRRSNLAVTAIALVGLSLLTLTAELQAPRGDPLAEPPSIASFDGFFFPLERNRFLRPDIDVNSGQTRQYDLTAIALSLNGERAWAAGRDGTFLRSENGGRSWTLKRLDANNPLLERPQNGVKKSSFDVLSSAFAGPGGPPPGPASDSEGSAGGSAAVKRRPDGPRQASPPGPPPNVQQRPPEADVQIKLKEPPLTTREQRTLPPLPELPLPKLGAPPDGPVDFFDVHFLPDGKRGWMAGREGTILHTLDGGVSWVTQTRSTLADFMALAFDANGQNGCAVGVEGAIVHTDNGGEVWTVLEKVTRNTLTAVVITESGVGWAVGADGVIVQTKDRCRTWTVVQESNSTALWSLSAGPTGQRVVGVGQGGIIMTSTDSGATWQRHSTSAGQTLESVFFNSTGQLGWAVGAAGTVLRTQDGAAKWTATAVSPRKDLAAVAFANDARRGIIVGEAFTILTTRDGGSTWHRATHQRYPAPWFYVAGILLLTWLGIRYYRNYKRAQEESSATSIIDKGESDEPIVNVAQDRLGFSRLVKGLAGYLRNLATVPPLTIAISAPWGGGKSSLMSMLRTEMRSVGVRSVWFNAWHHQKEDVMLASLLESIRVQALPFWLTPEGFTFRAKLLWRRARVHPFLAFVACCTLLLAGWHLMGAFFAWLDDKSNFVGGWVEYVAYTVELIWELDSAGPGDKQLLDKLADGKLTEFAVGLMSAVFGRPETLLYSIEVVVMIAAVVMVLLYGLRSFPGSPGVLLASVASQFKIAQVQAQTSYRQRFRTHFHDVCEALRPRTMLIFIDDLDRCEPEKTAEMLEAINYLANSGPCFIIVGMARDIVEAQLSIHFAKIAEAHSAAEGPSDAGANVPKRRASDSVIYVQNYLRKLINLEIQIPELTRGKMYSLLGVEDVPAEDVEDTRSRTRRIADALERTWRRHATAIVATAVVLAAIGLVMYVQAGIKEWDVKRVAKIGDERKAAAERLEKIRDAEQRAAVALDFARGKEKRIATRLFERHKVAVAGLEFRLPLGEFPAVKGPISDLCKEKLSPTAQPRDVNDVDQSLELACWRSSSQASRAVEMRLNEIKASLAAASSARSRDAFDRIARELTKTQKLADEAEQISGTKRDSEVIGDSPEPTVPSSPPTPTAQPKDPSAEGQRESEHMTWPYALMLGILLPLALYALTRREPYVIKDEPYFRDALRVWSPLLGSESAFTVPREVKRFQNRARFYAMRLRAPAPRRHWFDRLVNRFEQWEERWQTHTR